MTAFPQVIGHRGAAAAAPENTLAGLRKAKKLGASWVEFDVKLTRDGVPILMHDRRLERTTNGRGPVALTTLAELEKLDAGGWFGPEFRGERVPTFEAALALCAELGLGINVEIKPCPGRESETARATVETLRRCWPDPLPAPLISSARPACLGVARDLAPELPRGYLAVALPRRWRDALETYRCSTLNLSARRLGPFQRAALVAAGVPLLLYTVNNPRRARRLLEAGVAAIFTDRVAEVLNALGPVPAVSSGASGRPAGPAP